jgi:Zn-dependent protease with chaperone function
VTYVTVGVVLTLAGFLAANLILSLCVAALAGPLARRAWLEQPLLRARLLYGLRVFPTMGTVLFSLGVVLPAYVLFEPRATTERPGLVLLALAAGAAALIGSGLARGLASFVVTRRVMRSWLRDAQLIGVNGVTASAYRVPDPCAAVSLVGTWRPKIFLSGQILAALSAQETAVAVAHEAAHLRFHDNLKRWALRFSPDVLCWLPAGRRLEREWGGAAETVADARATQGDRERALHLSAALLKVARLAPGRASLALAASGLQGGPEFAARIRRLVDGRLFLENRDRMGRALVATSLVLAAGWVCLVLFTPEAFAGIHQAAETVLAALR